MKTKTELLSLREGDLPEPLAVSEEPEDLPEFEQEIPVMGVTLTGQQTWNMPHRKPALTLGRQHHSRGLDP